MNKKSLPAKIVEAVSAGAAALVPGATPAKPLSEMPETPLLVLPENGTSTATARFTRE